MKLPDDANLLQGEDVQGFFHNSFDLNALFQVLFSLFFTVYKSNIQLIVLASWCPNGFLEGREKCF